MTFNGALVHLGSSNPVSVPNSYYAATYIKAAFPTIVYDTGGFWDATTSQFVIPSNIPANTYGQLICNVRWQDSGGYRVQALISKYDASAGVQLQSYYPEAAPDNRLFTGGTTTDHITVTHPILLEAGDAYACQLWQSGATGSAGSICVVQAGFSLRVFT